eukprot:TRINITY_DN3677_c0_g1_i3.p1 TRINITY_DN3677_c0_g1~~TRINITY_DN3677_c0_g1_i3.p1  ORF type:complete len:212 (+),score=27.79 TRINITY_DN3677_c0_g1_i3:87-638(+)
MVVEVLCFGDVLLEHAMKLGGVGVASAAGATAFVTVEDQLHPWGHHDPGTTQVIESMPAMVDKAHGLDLDQTKMLYDEARSDIIRLREGIPSDSTPVISTPTDDAAVEQSDCAPSNVPLVGVTAAPVTVGSNFLAADVDDHQDLTKAPGSPRDVDVPSDTIRSGFDQVFWFAMRFVSENFLCK